MDKLTILLVVACITFFVVAIIGAVAALYISQVSKRWMQLCNSLAGGVMLSVALCHMLAENSGELKGWSSAIGKALGGEEFPLGFFSAGAGFFIMVTVEYLLGGHDHEAHDSSSESDSESDRARDQNMGATKSLRDVEGTPLAGYTAFLGIGVHALIEAIATGSAPDAESFGFLLIAVLLHKGFAAFAVASSLLPLMPKQKAIWWTLNIVWAALGPIGLITGAIIRSNIEGQGTALLQCIAAGSLIGVAITEMIAEGLSDKTVWKKRKIMAMYFGFISMGVIAVWV